MKPLRITFLTLLLFAALAVAWVMVSGLLRERRWREHPDAAFRDLTKSSLPEGVRATAFDREMNDALWRSTNYWLLEGSPDQLLTVAKSTHLAAGPFQTGDAQWLEHRFGIPDRGTKVVAYFTSRDDGTGDHVSMRSYFVMENGTAYFVQ